LRSTAAAAASVRRRPVGPEVELHAVVVEIVDKPSRGVRLRLVVAVGDRQLDLLVADAHAAALVHLLLTELVALLG
jgi:hypothetical protein